MSPINDFDITAIPRVREISITPTAELVSGTPTPTPTPTGEADIAELFGEPGIVFSNTEPQLIVSAPSITVSGDVNTTFTDHIHQNSMDGVTGAPVSGTMRFQAGLDSRLSSVNTVYWSPIELILTSENKIVETANSIDKEFDEQFRTRKVSVETMKDLLESKKNRSIIRQELLKILLEEPDTVPEKLESIKEKIIENSGHSTQKIKEEFF